VVLNNDIIIKHTTNNMAKRLIQKKILYLENLLTETKGFYMRLQIKFTIWNERIKLKKYK
jgi:hypothetical protein